MSRMLLGLLALTLFAAVRMSRSRSGVGQRTQAPWMTTIGKENSEFSARDPDAWKSYFTKIPMKW